MASNIVLHVFPNTNATTNIWELANSRNLLVAIPNIKSHIIIIIMATNVFTIRCSVLTAVFVSFKVKASALLSLKAFTWMKQVPITVSNNNYRNDQTEIVTKFIQSQTGHLYGDLALKHIDIVSSKGTLFLPPSFSRKIC